MVVQTQNFRNLMISIVDYGVGNIGSVVGLVRELNLRYRVSKDPTLLASGDVILLPGVGSARTALRNLKDSPLLDFLSSEEATQKPFVGICLGGQLLFHLLEEADGQGLGLLEGSVKVLKYSQVNTGWLGLDMDELSAMGLSRGLKRSDTYFFNHGFEMKTESSKAAVCHSSGYVVEAIVNSQSCWAIQLHPEKSQRAGVLLMRNVINAATK